MTDQAPAPYAGPKRVLSGVQPSGALHLGNYLGALVKFTRLQHETDTFIFVADMHAITVWQDPKLLAGQVREITAAYLASGLDPKVATIFPQSAVPQHAELAWIFNCVARLGWLDRMTQFKEKSGKHKERASVGLYTYPVLQAADILVYKATHVPVGEDQKQHLELARDIAQKFNTDFEREVFPQPEPLIFGAATRVMSLRDGSKKMSKSDPSDASRINLTDDADTIAKKFRKAVTDPARWPAHHGHEALGVPLVLALCERLRVPVECRDLARLVTQFHGVVHQALSLRAATVLRLLMAASRNHQTQVDEWPRIMLAAPTGKAAQRGGFARTIMADKTVDRTRFHRQA